MSIDERSPPPSARVDASALARIFSDTTTSYKYLWFQAILSELATSNFSKNNFELTSLLHRTLTLAWYPKVFFRLSFGAQDKIGGWFDAASVNAEGTISSDAIFHAISKQISAENEKDFLRYVPFRMLSPFFEPQLTRCPDHQKNHLIQRLANEHFATQKPLYRFQSKSEIQIHPDWLEYLAINFPLISGWSNWNWLQYLQQRNPNVPAVASKLHIPLYRNSLEKQRIFWRLACREKPLICIYSGLPLNSVEMSLDHFLPWSFVGHDQLWNLIPASPNANSAKNNRLPDETYIEQFILSHHRALHATKATMRRSEWGNAIECYLNDLHLDSVDALLNIDTLEAAYRSTISPLLLIARNMGFGHGWKH